MTLLTKDEILELKSKAEVALQQVNLYVTQLRQQGFNVAPGKDGTMCITRHIPEVYGEPEQVGSNEQKSPGIVSNACSQTGDQGCASTQGEFQSECGGATEENAA
jgi:hypothetical protein